jgi:hypothetical protein
MRETLCRLEKNFPRFGWSFRVRRSATTRVEPLVTARMGCLLRCSPARARQRRASKSYSTGARTGALDSCSMSIFDKVNVLSQVSFRELEIEVAKPVLPE